MRTIVTVQGRTAIAFVLAVFEIIIWVLVAGAVITQVKEAPLVRQQDPEAFYITEQAPVM